MEKSHWEEEEERDSRLLAPRLLAQAVTRQLESRRCSDEKFTCVCHWTRGNKWTATTIINLFNYFLLNLVNQLINPDFNLLSLFFLRLPLRVLPFASSLHLLSKLLSAPSSPCVPFINQPLAQRNELRADVALIRNVLFVKLTAVFS